MYSKQKKNLVRSILMRIKIIFLSLQNVWHWQVIKCLSYLKKKTFNNILDVDVTNYPDNTNIKKYIKETKDQQDEFTRKL